MSIEKIFKLLYHNNHKQITSYTMDLANELVEKDVDHNILIKMSIIYLIRIHKFNEVNILLYVTYSMIIASKYILDDYFDLEELADIVNYVREKHCLSDIHKRDIFYGEIDMLVKLDWNAHIELEEIKELDSLCININERDVGDRSVNHSNLTCIIH